VDAIGFIGLATRGDEQAALAALERDADLARARNAQGVSVVCLAVYNGRRRLAATLAERRADLDIFEASCIGDAARVRTVLAEYPDQANAVSPDGYGALGYSAFFGHSEVLQELIARGADVNAPARNAMAVRPVNSAAAHPDPELAVTLLRALLAAGADPNGRQSGGYTALHEAALNGNAAMIHLLLDHGADTGLANDEGALPADLARGKGHAEAVRLLE
jgi:ankyrin repeat protein